VVYLARRGTHLPIWVAEHKGCVGRSPHALIKRPQAFPVQPFLRLGGKLAIANDIDHTLSDDPVAAKNRDRGDRSAR